MGFFGNLFEKKICAICGEEIGLFGNRKLEDGNCCKHCAAKLSPWFNERRESTVAEIKEQLAYREANREKVANFHATRTLGGDGKKVLVDERAGTFVVTSARDLAEDNPDVIDLCSVTGCEVEPRENRDEVRRRIKKSDGSYEYRSYDPRRYKYKYTLTMHIYVDHPYFDEMRFDLNTFSIEVDGGEGWNDRLKSSWDAPSRFERSCNYEYSRYEDMGEEIKRVLLSHRYERDTERREENKREKPEHEGRRRIKVKVVCPWCGSSVSDDGSGTCPLCGGSLHP